MTMKIILVALISIALASTQSCTQGQLKINGVCLPCGYIAGCAQYTSNGSCGLCEYGYQLANGKCNYADRPTS